MASKQTITPFVPPVTKRLEERGGGPSTPASSLLHRMGVREVDDDVIAVVAWALSHFSAKPTVTALWDLGKSASARGLRPPQLTARVEKELLDDLGLEWKETPMGGLLLVPKAEYLSAKKPKPMEYSKVLAKHGGWNDSERYYFPSAAKRDAFIAELRAAGHSATAELVLAHATIKSGGRK